MADTNFSLEQYLLAVSKQVERERCRVRKFLDLRVRRGFVQDDNLVRSNPRLPRFSLEKYGFLKKTSPSLIAIFLGLFFGAITFLVAYALEGDLIYGCRGLDLSRRAHFCAGGLWLSQSYVQPDQSPLA